MIKFATNCCFTFSCLFCSKLKHLLFHAGFAKLTTVALLCKVHLTWYLEMPSKKFLFVHKNTMMNVPDYKTRFNFKCHTKIGQ